MMGDLGTGKSGAFIASDSCMKSIKEGEKMKRTSAVLVLCFAVIIFVIALLSAVPAYAVPVTYTFSGTDYDGVGNFSFAYTAPDFITSRTDLNPYQLDWWSVTGFEYLINVYFAPNDANNWDSIWIMVPVGGLYLWYFGEDSFSTPGTYPNISSGNPGTLTVSTPEPSLMVLLGISIMSVAGLRKWWRE